MRILTADSSQLRQTQLLMAIAVVATVLALLTTAQAGLALAHEGQEIPWAGLLKARLVDWYSCALFMPLLFWLARRFPVDRQQWTRTLPIHLLASVPIAILKEGIFVAVGNLFRPGLFDLTDILAEDLSYEVIAVWGFSCLAHALVFHERFTNGKEDDRAAPAAIADHIVVRTTNGVRLVRTDDIEWIDAQGNYARLSTSQGRFLVRDTMARLEKRLGSRFMRVHRRIIIRVDRVVRVEPRLHAEYWLYLASGERIGSGRSFGPAIRQLWRE